MNDKITIIKEQIEDDMILFHNHEFKSYIEDYKAYIGDVSDNLKNKDEWQSNVSHPLVYMMIDTMYGTIFDFDYQLKIKDPDIEKACVDAYDFHNNSKRVMGLAGKEALITGTGIMRDYTYLEEGHYEGLGHKIPYTIKSPTMEYISVFNVMYDRMKGLKDSNYKIVRQFLTEEEIKQRIISRHKNPDKRKIMLNNVKKLKENNNAFSMYNYEAIKLLIFTTEFQDSMKDAKGKIKKSYNTDIKTESSCKNLNYNRSDIAETIITGSPYYNDFNRKYEVVEFIEGINKYIFINGEYILTEQINPHIYNLVSISFNEIPGAGRNIGISKIIKQLADSSNGLMNMFLDNMKLANTLVFRTKAALQKKDAKLKIRSGMVVGDGIERVNLGGGDFGGMNGVQALQQVAQAVLGINQMIMGGDGRVQRIAGAFDFAFSQYKARLTPFTDSIDSAMTKIVKGWISQYLYFYTAEELLDLYGIQTELIKEKGKIIDIKVGTVKMSELLNENNISFKFDSLYNLKKDSDKKIAIDIFQTAEQYNNSKVDKIEFLKLLSGDQNASLGKVLGIDKELDELDDISDIDVNNLDELVKDNSLEEIEPVEEVNSPVDTFIPNENYNSSTGQNLPNNLM